MIRNGTGNAEFGIRQKLNMMENAIARISSQKTQLRNEVEQARKDICDAVDHQLSCIRAREKELLIGLDNVLTKKEQLLMEQQQQLNQAIGACRQALECVLHNKVDPAGVHEMLIRMNGLELRPKEKSSIVFEFDPSDLRRDTAKFGRILEIEDRTKTSETLPIDVEPYEDEALLSHKSVIRLPRNSISAGADRGGETGGVAASGLNSVSYADSVNYWLAQVNSCGESDADFECIRERFNSFSGSSFDVLNPSVNFNYLNGQYNDNSFFVTVLNSSDQMSPQVFNSHFDELNNMPAEFWLPKVEPRAAEEKVQPPKNMPRIEAFWPPSMGTQQKAKEAEKSRQKLADLDTLINEIKLENVEFSPAAPERKSSIPAANQRKRVANSPPDAYESQNASVEMGKVITGIVASDAGKWLLKESKMTSIDCEDSDMDGGEGVISKKKCLRSNPYFDGIFENDDISFWLKNYPKKMDRPMNEMSEDLSSWESVLGWKSILEKIHASGEDVWLAPSSRTTK